MTSMTKTSTTTACDSLRCERPRSGKWTKEEEAYVDLLIEEFRCGALPLREGTTLRSFLSKMINCNPKRVSKKYENTNYNGKHKYEPSTVPMSFAEMKRRRERLQEYERRFMEALARMSDDPELEEQQIRASFEEETRSITAESKKLLGSNYQTGKEASTFAILQQQHKQFPYGEGTSKRPSLATSFQDRLTAELHSKMDRSSLFSGGGATTADLRDLSVTNTANMSLTLPSAFASPRPGASKLQVSTGPALHQLSALDLMSSIKQQNSPSARLAGKPTLTTAALPDHHHHLDKMRHSELSEDPLMRQVRMQQQAAVEQRAQRMLSLDRNSFEDVSFPILPEAKRLRHLHPPSGLDHHLSPLQIEEQLGGLAQGLSSRDMLVGGGQRGSFSRSSFVSEYGMYESLKREREGVLDNFRPFKRIR